MWAGYEQSRFGCRRLDQIGAGGEEEVWIPMMSEIFFVCWGGGGVLFEIWLHNTYIYIYILNKSICCLVFETKSIMVL